MFPTNSYELQTMAHMRRQEMIDTARDWRLAEEGRRRRAERRTARPAPRLTRVPTPAATPGS